MSAKRNNALSSRELLAKLGIDESAGEESLLFDDEPLDSSLDDLAAALRERFQGLKHRQAFQPGDVVLWKPGLKNRRWPAYSRKPPASPVRPGRPRGVPISPKFRPSSGELVATRCNSWPAGAAVAPAGCGFPQCPVGAVPAADRTGGAGPVADRVAQQTQRPRR